LIKVPVERIREEIRDRRARRVLLQVPEGIKTALGRYIPDLEAETGATILLHGDPCYGSCDLAQGEGERLKVDIILHIAHTPLREGEARDKTIFIDAYDEINISRDLLEKVLELSQGRVMGLVSSIQYINLLPIIREYIEAAGGRALIGHSRSKHMREGQILGCDVSAARSLLENVNGFLVVGGGTFHGLGVALGTGKKTWILDPSRDELIDLSPLAKKTLALVAARIEDAKDAQVWGVIIGLKEGQMRLEEAFHIAEELKRRRRKVVKIALGEISPERLRYYPWIGAYVQTLCPRISLDDIGNFDIPVLSPDQFKIMTGEKRFEEVYPYYG
jgi:2-(3-amino-3-carboxypropyl)histidine synthase